MNSDLQTYRVLFVLEPLIRAPIEARLAQDETLIPTFLSFSDVSMEKPKNFDLILFGIRPSMLVKTIRIARSWELKSHAIIAEDLKAHEVVRLMKAGFTEVFDLSNDLDLLHEWLMTQYEDELLRRSEPGSRSEWKPEHRIQGSSDGIQMVREMAVQAAAFSDLTILVQGETGTGKEMVARLIHEQSPRKRGPFIEVNCSAIPETLMEAEMLGYEKGAFTDARRSKAGFFELASNGTLFLDEIGLMPPSLQNKILKIVEEKKFRRLGGEMEVSVDVRVVAGTNEDLVKASQEGRFRSDLLYRLKVFSIVIPPLRERTEDISLLAGFFLDDVKSRYKLNISGFHPTSEKMLIQYHWPGNVRELKHTVERACVLANRGRILPSHLPDEIQAVAMTRIPAEIDGVSMDNHLCIPLPENGISMDEIEYRVMTEILNRCGGNQSKASRFLKISRTRLIRKLSDKE